MKTRILRGGLIALMLFIMPQAALATSWAYPFVVWNNGLYIVTDEIVEDADRKIGKVTSYSDMEQKGGNFSNRFPKGTAYYEIKGTPTTEAIAIEQEKGQFIKAVYEGEYVYSGDIWDKAKMLFFVVIVAVISFIGYYILPSFRKA